MKGTMIVLYS